MMNKIIALLAVVFVGGIVAFTSINWSSGGEQQTSQSASLKNGGTIELTKKEASIPVSQGERKVVLTDLGMT